MQALAERLDDALRGTTFAGADPFQFFALKTVTPTPESLQGRTVQSVVRPRGKFVAIELGGRERPGQSGGRGPRLLFHLSQGGRVDLENPPKRTKPKGAVVRLRFDPAPAVLIKEYGTERKAGWWLVDEGDDGPLAVLGPDPFSDEFAALIRESTDSRRVHTLLRDQRTVAGIGRGYADDILHRARISPYASLHSLAPDDRRRLLDAARAVLTEALEAERRRSGGLPTNIGDHFAVHGRYGTPCPTCGEDLRRVSYESHEIAYCPACQTGGKVLADRRLSRLVR